MCLLKSTLFTNVFLQPIQNSKLYFSTDTNVEYRLHEWSSHKRIIYSHSAINTVLNTWMEKKQFDVWHMSMYTNFNGSFFLIFVSFPYHNAVLNFVLNVSCSRVSEIHLQHFVLYSKPSFMMPLPQMKCECFSVNTVLESIPLKQRKNFTLAYFYELLDKIASFISVKNVVCLDSNRYRLFWSCQSANPGIVLGIDVTWFREECVSSLAKL